MSCLDLNLTVLGNAQSPGSSSVFLLRESQAFFTLWSRDFVFFFEGGKQIAELLSDLKTQLFRVQVELSSYEKVPLSLPKLLAQA